MLRRSIDRLWEDQSIETCDDWVIPYIGDLLGTNLVPGSTRAGQRLDVANTIYYRRRKGTRGDPRGDRREHHRLGRQGGRVLPPAGRTRHGLDPAIGLPLTPGDAIDQLQQAEGLVGPLTRTGIGGFADLRNVYGAAQVGTAFDEFFHTADTRRGDGRVGWHDIPHLGVFVWRLLSFRSGRSRRCRCWAARLVHLRSDRPRHPAVRRRIRAPSTRPGLRLRLDLAHRGATAHADKPEPA